VQTPDTPVTAVQAPTGLSRLDFFAAMALQGFLSHEGTRGMSQALAQKAFELAKHMVEESKKHAG
jgi:hypothetical protein